MQISYAGKFFAQVLITWLITFFVSINGLAAREIALTFDDAPMGDSNVMSGAKRTDTLIKALRDARVDDTLFFVTTKNISDETQNRLDKYVQAGFYLANHSHSHDSANKIETNAFMLDVYRAHLILKENQNVLPYFRFPYLHYGKNEKSVHRLQDDLEELGYKDGYATVDNYEWYINSLLNKAAGAGKSIDYKKLEEVYVSVLWEGIEFYDGIAKKVLGRSPKHVLVLHENDTSALFIPALVKRIRDKGWKIISPQEAYSDPISNGFPATHFHKQGRIAALAHLKGMDIKDLRHKSENQAYLDELMENTGVFK